jgi:quercetin dioxygenase-like cupin family protein
MVFVTAAVGLAFAQQSAITPILPENLQWTTPPNIPAVRSAWLLGGEQQAGTYAMRVVLSGNGRIPPHTHPDTRYSTVLSGTLYVGLGTRFDPTALVAVPAGGVYVAPAGVAHFLWAKDGEVIYQEAGMGPTGTRVLP